MDNGIADSGTGINVIFQNLVVTLDPEPDDNDLQVLRKNILATIETTPVRGVIMDVSKVKIIDSILFDIMVKTAKMIKLLGAQTVFVGFRAGVAAALVDLDVDLEGIDTAVTMEDAIEFLTSNGLEENNDRVLDDLQSE